MYYKVVGRPEHKATSRYVGVAGHAFAGKYHRLNLSFGSAKFGRRTPRSMGRPTEAAVISRTRLIRCLRTEFSEGTLGNALSGPGSAS